MRCFERFLDRAVEDLTRVPPAVVLVLSLLAAVMLGILAGIILAP